MDFDLCELSTELFLTARWRVTAPGEDARRHTASASVMLAPNPPDRGMHDPPRLRARPGC